ncbi:MAG: restriction endonuclease subunit S [Burkholderiales bacterium]|nr:restriction endonuclease subunit S [Burkholderiales bacterium]
MNMSYLYKPLDGNHGDIHPKSSDFVASGIPFIMANNVRNGILDLENCAFITKKQADRLQKGFSITGDVLLTHKGTVGNVVMVKNLYTDYIMLTPQVTYYRVKDHSQLNRHYIFQYFLSKIFQQKLQEIAGGGTRAYIGITEQRSLPFILPPLKEQEKIAEMLSTWDDAIAKQEQLIKQKQVFKKGVMQQIFSQKIRFKDDNGNDYPAWQTKKLGDICIIKKGEQLNKVHMLDDGIYPVLNGGTDYSGLTDKYNTENSITVSEGGNSCGYVSFVKNKFWAGGHCYTVATKAVQNEYLFYLLKYQESKIMLLRVGSGLPNIQKSTLEKFLITVSCYLDEQTKIADFLTRIDDETTKQTEILNQLKLQKQSLVQKLLTGQVRV